MGTIESHCPLNGVLPQTRGMHGSEGRETKEKLERKRTEDGDGEGGANCDREREVGKGTEGVDELFPLEKSWIRQCRNGEMGIDGGHVLPKLYRGDSVS